MVEIASNAQNNASPDKSMSYFSKLIPKFSSKEIKQVSQNHDSKNTELSRKELSRTKSRNPENSKIASKKEE